MSEYTPTTDEMRFAWAERVNKHDQEGADEFDRWLAEVERAAAARALEEAADEWTQGAWSAHIPPRGAIRPQIILGMAQGAGDWLRARAAEIRGAS